MDLFEYMREQTKEQESPLASSSSNDFGGSCRTGAYYR